MLQVSRSDRVRTRGAFALSLLLHAAVAPLFLVSLPIATDNEPEQPTLLVRITTIVPKTAPAHSAPRSTPVRIAKKLPPQPPKVVATHIHRPAARNRSRRAPARPAPPAKVVAQINRANAPVATAAPAARTPVVLNTAAPTTAPPATPGPVREAPNRSRVATSAGGTDRGGYAVFGETRDPEFDVHTHQELAKLHARLTITVVVTDDGKIKSISFDPPTAPGDLQKQVVELLSHAQWDAAVCGGGIPCEGKAKIILSQ